MRHDHLPIYRVIRRGWPNPLDTSYSQLRSTDNRWNTPGFPALYCCCSPTVARAIVHDVFRLTSVDIEDLQEDARPQLVEIHWTGEVVDMITESAIVNAGFQADYPRDTGHSQTQMIASNLHSKGAEAILCRSASLSRLGFANWEGDHQFWSELAIFTQNAAVRPSLLKRHVELDWLFFSNPET